MVALIVANKPTQCFAFLCQICQMFVHIRLYLNAWTLIHTILLSGLKCLLELGTLLFQKEICGISWTKSILHRNVHQLWQRTTDSDNCSNRTNMGSKPTFKTDFERPCSCTVCYNHLLHNSDSSSLPSLHSASPLHGIAIQPSVRHINVSVYM